MTSISLTANVRSSLLALQDTAAQQAITNNHLATGKKVSSALDNPVNFFTAQSLNSRSSQLTSLLDGISNGIQTIQAANKGLTSITSLIQQIQSTVTQARQDTSATVTPGTAVTTTAANTSASAGSKLSFTVGGQSININTTSTATTATQAVLTGTGATFGGTAGTARSFTIAATGFNGGSALTVSTVDSGDSAAAAATKINTALSAISGNTITADGSSGQLVLKNSNGNNVTVGGTDAANVGFGTGNTTSNNGVPVGSVTALTTDQLVTAITSNGQLAGKVTASNVGGKLSLVNNTTSSIAVTGFSASALDGGAATSTLAAGTAALSASRQSLANQFNSLTSQLDKISTDSGYNGVNLLQGDHLKVVFNEKTGTNANSIDVSAKNSDNTDFGTVNSFNLGIGQAATSIGGAGTDFTSNSALDTLGDTLKNALTTIQTQSSALGANLSVVQTRQDFTKQIVDVLTTGAGNLTDADMNQEAANSQSLSTRNSLAISALSLANTSNQGVLQLLR